MTPAERHEMLFGQPIERRHAVRSIADVREMLDALARSLDSDEATVDAMSVHHAVGRLLRDVAVWDDYRQRSPK